MPMPAVLWYYHPTPTLKYFTAAVFYLFIKLEPEQHFIAHRLLFHSARGLIKNVTFSHGL